ncbi:MAG: hypothetical protein HRU49_14615 [Winogradskyella sp.]|uniref:tail fiber protein n=1 Tax=Winogradskyella sp. TaxID=1883156 RepID=UPI0025D72ACA|nr:tail fiber protein [Winogradskyella sp.]NRB84982.1 hypothetical protein [Winogradskyella sp.]
MKTTIKIAAVAMIGMSLGIYAQENKIEATGNVGIGTTSPSTKLNVVSNENKNSTKVLVLRATGTGSESNMNYDRTKQSLGIGFNRLWGSNETNLAGIYSYGSYGWRGGLVFKTKNSTTSTGEADIEAMVIRPDGNVGIGTTQPDMELTVNGKIHTKEVKIDLSIPAPDYVFKSDYKLRSIEEVESFIKENSHLPEIPSAKEFAKNGVMQAEMDMNLLKKIEELTLYTIDQQKEINSQKKEIEELKKQNSEIKELKVLVEKLLKDNN